MKTTTKAVSYSITGLFLALGMMWSFPAAAQWPSQSLFYRSQAMQYQELLGQARMNSFRNGAYVSNPSVQFPLQCHTSEDIQSSWRQGELYFMRLKWDESAQVYAGCIKQDSSFCDAYFRLAQCYVSRGNLAGGLSLLRLAEHKFPKNPMVYLGLGQLYLMLEYPETALQNFHEMGKLGSGDPEFYLGASIALYHVGHYDDALDYLRQGMDQLHLRSQAVPRFTYNGRYMSGGSGNTFSTSIPNYLLVYEGILHFKLDDINGALRLLKRLNNINPQEELEGTRQYFMGLCYLAQGENHLSEARDHIRQATRRGIALEPIVAKELGMMCDPADTKTLLLKERYPEGRIRPPSVKGLGSLGDRAEVAFMNKRPEESSQLFSKLVQADSNYLHGYLRMAECYRLIGKQEECLRISKIAYRHAPSNATAGLRLAREYVRSDSLDAALRIYLETISRHPNREEAYYAASILLGYQGRIRPALDRILAYERGKPLSRKMTSIKGILFYQLGLSSIALQHLSRASRRERDPVTAYFMAMCFHTLGPKFEMYASDNLNVAMALGALVDSETQRKLGLDPTVHRFSTLTEKN